MRENAREIATAGAVVGGLLVGLAMAAGMGGDRPALRFFSAHEEDVTNSAGYGGLGAEDVEAPGTAWFQLPVCSLEDPGERSPEVRDVRLLNSQGLTVEAVLVDSSRSPEQVAEEAIEAGTGLGWPPAGVEGTSWGSVVTANCDEDYGGGSFLGRQNLVHVVVSVEDLGADRLAGFDAIGVDWAVGGRTGTSHLATAMGFCTADQKKADCQALFDAGEDRRDALREAWRTGEEPAKTTRVLQGPDGPVEVPDVRTGQD